MKKILLAAALLGATSTFALAADLPSRRAPPVYVPPVIAPAFTWTGFYAGLNAGYAFNGYSYNNLAATNAVQQNGIATGGRLGFLRQSSNGFTGGGQIGYNYQLGGGLPVLGNVFGTGAGGFVIGLEADAAYTSLRNDTTYVSATGTGNLSTYHSNTDFIGTVRGRVGYAFGDLLIFGTGGFAYGDVNKTDTFTGAIAYSGVGNGLRTGYAYGGGIEYAIPTTSFVNFFKSSAVTLKAEYIHYNLGTQSVVLVPSAGANPYINNIRTTGDIVRAGINYKIDLFGSPTVPVVARY